MKLIIFLIFIVSVFITANSQGAEISQFWRLPKPEDVAKIEISNTSAINWYQPAELLKLLPNFAPDEGTYVSKQPLQRGTFILKNGKYVWLSPAHKRISTKIGSRKTTSTDIKGIDYDNFEVV